MTINNKNKTNNKNKRLLFSAEEDRNLAKHNKRNKLLNALSSYQLAYDDQDFILRDEMRPVRLMLELTKAEMILKDHNINHTIVVFGSSRTPRPEDANALLDQANTELSQSPNNQASLEKLELALKQVKQAKYYSQARKLAKLITSKSQQSKTPLFITTGGGPGIMEAANLGACDANGKSIGLNIVLPHEQNPNAYITPELCFQFHYFAIRKMHFLMRARALVVFPGGYGTLDELFDALTLLQTKKIKPLPILLFGKAYWQKVINFELLLDEGVITSKDLELFKYVESVDEAWQIIQQFIKS